MMLPAVSDLFSMAQAFVMSCNDPILFICLDYCNSMLVSMSKFRMKELPKQHPNYRNSFICQNIWEMQSKGTSCQGKIKFKVLFFGQASFVRFTLAYKGELQHSGFTQSRCQLLCPLSIAHRDILVPHSRTSKWENHTFGWWSNPLIQQKLPKMLGQLIKIFQTVTLTRL